MVTYFQWLKADFGFDESKVKPYTFNAQPFLADKNSAMEGYVTSEPYAVEKQAHFKPAVFLLADHGFNSYSTLIETRRDLVAKRPDLVQRFVDASAIGWYHYIYGDSRPGNELIKKQNPEMTDDQLAFSIAQMRQDGIVDSGNSLKLGIGAMTDARWQSFYDKMVHAGVVKPGLDYKRSYTLQFVNKGVGVDLGQNEFWFGHRLAAQRRQDVRQRHRRARRSHVLTCATANSSRCSVRPAAASRPRCASSPA